MKTSDEMKASIQYHSKLCETTNGNYHLSKKESAEYYLPKVESLENDLEYYKHGVEELRKENEAIKKNIILVLEILSGGKNEIKR